MSTISLAKNGTPRLFFWLLQQQFTGLVHLRDLPGLGQATIWVHEGLPWFTDLHSSSSLLGELLLVRRKLRQDQLHQALVDMAQSGRLLGHVLVAQGILDAPTLGESLAFQCEHKLCQLFKLNSGQAQVEAQANLSGLSAGLTRGVNSLHLIMYGIRRHWDVARMTAVWGQSRGQCLRATASFSQYAAHFGLSPAETKAAQTLAQGWVLGSPDPDGSLERVAFALWNCGMIETIRSAGRAPAAAAPPPDTGSHPPAQTPAAASSHARAVVQEASRAEPLPKRAGSRKVPVARSGRPITSVPIRPNKSSDQTSRLHKIPARMMHDRAANQRGSVGKDPQARTKFVRELESLEGLIAREVHAFALFDLPITATRSQVRQRWNHLSSTFHPDALPKLDLANMHARAQRVFAHLSSAYQVLSNAARRKELKAQLESGIGPGQDATDFVRQSLEAENLVRDAERMLKKHQYDRAKELLSKANDLREDQGEVLAGLAWCDYQLQKRSDRAATAALAELKKITQKHTKCANAWYYLGLVHSARDQRGPAQRAFTQALEHNPRLLDAQRQLRALEQSKAAGQDKGKRKKLFGR